VANELTRRQAIVSAALAGTALALAAPGAAHAAGQSRNATLDLELWLLTTTPKH
jgi:hypothetical protein